MDESPTGIDRLPRRMLGVWAHPDDESYLSAGLMARVVDGGGRVTVVTATDGELGFPDHDDRSPERRGALRRHEMRAAMAALGVADIRFLGLPDGGLADADQVRLRDRIRRVIDEVRPEMIVTFGPDGVTGHPDHIAISRATTSAWCSARSGRLLHACHPASWWDEFAEVHDRVGLTGGGAPPAVHPTEIAVTVALDELELDRKRVALSAHGSQTAELARTMGEATYRRWWATEWLRDPAET